MNQYCYKCGNVLTSGSRYCSFCGAQQPETVLESAGDMPQQTGYSPEKQQKSMLGLVAIITAAVVAVVCVASWFLFFADKPAKPNDGASTLIEVAEAWNEPVENPVWGSPQDLPTPSDRPLPTQAAQTVSDQTIIVSMAYDSGEGVYTGEVNDNGIPNGNGHFEMITSDNGNIWSYEGWWENGEITGEGVMTQGGFIFTGSFKSGLLDGCCEIMDNGILRYKGMCVGGKLHGQGTLYTSSGMLLFEGEFDTDMLVESETARQARGAAFKLECEDMDELLYGACMAQDNTFGYAVAVWGFPVAMGEQTANGTIVIGHMGEGSYPVCLVYRYGVDEPKLTSDDWINAWGVVAGLYEYVDGDGLTVTCPIIEVVCWDSEQEGL